uniref:Uncharacterized protein n=1 Tax=Acrobeloides nanus TaxID=290746 RepID=A0A914DW28_9BILA
MSLPRCGFVEMCQRLKVHPCKGECKKMIVKTTTGFTVVGAALSLVGGYKIGLLRSARFPFEFLYNTWKFAVVGIVVGAGFGTVNCFDQIAMDVEEDKKREALETYARYQIQEKGKS